jgi:uncharacterized membrane protein YfcA
MMEPVTRQVPLLEEVSDDLEPVQMADFDAQPRHRLDSISSVSTTASTVSIRHGRVRDIRPKAHIPHLHKVIAGITVVLVTLAVLWMVSPYNTTKYGLFRSTRPDGMAPGTPEDDVWEHEREVDWDGKDIAGFMVASILIMIAAGGGIGGGGVLVPTYIFVLGFEPKYAIPLSNCTILGSSLSNLILNVNKRHEYADRPLIDWDIMLMMEPLTVAGALVGTFVNVVSPPWLITIMLVILLTAAAIRTLKKGVKRYKQETKRFERQASMKMDVLKDGYTSLPDQQAGRQGDSKRDPAGPKFKADPSLPSASSVLAWSPEDVKQWWERSLPPGCQEYIHIVDECELDGADLLDLDYISLSQFDVKKMLIMKILRRIKQLKQSLGIPETTATQKSIAVKGTDPDEKPSNEDLEKIPPGERDPRRVKAENEGNQLLVDLLQDESIHPPWKVALMFLCAGGMLTLTILKGGGDINPLNVECGTATYWTLTLLSLPWVLMISFIARNHLLKRFYEKSDSGYEYLPQDIVWDETATIRYPALCSTAGLAAGMFGIGGGIVKGPLMLEMNVYPPVTSATSATMILFTSAGASVSYLIFQQLNLNYAMYLFCFGLCFTFIGQVALNGLVKRSGRSSYIVLIIGLTVALSACAMGFASAGHVVKLFKGEAESGGDICSAGGE